MTEPRPVFFVGNKRSGTTLLVNMLNEHPDICITHESDVIWILFQTCVERRTDYRPFPFDAPRGMNAVVAAYGEKLQDILGTNPNSVQVRSAYFEVQRWICERGTEVHHRLKNAQQIMHLGDKKPVQHASPELFEFIRQHFSDALFVHLIRHPWAVVASTMEAARTWPVVPDYWKGTAADVLLRWCLHEEWVLDIQRACPDKLITIRLEDLVTQPVSTMERLFRFLEIQPLDCLAQRYSNYAYSGPNDKYASFQPPFLPPGSGDNVRLFVLFGPVRRDHVVF